MRSFLTSAPVATRVMFTLLCTLTICSINGQAQMTDQTRIDKAVQVVKDLCLVGTQYDLHVDAKGNIVIKSLRPCGEGTVTINSRLGQGATAIYDEKLRIIADTEVRDCTKSHIPRIIDTILGDRQSKSPSSPSAKESDPLPGNLLTSPTKLIEKIRESPPFYRDEVSRRYIGLTVEWNLKLHSVSKESKDSIRVTFFDERHFVVHCTVLLSKYRNITLLSEGTNVKVKGTITEINVDLSLTRLENAELFF